MLTWTTSRTSKLVFVHSTHTHTHTPHAHTLLHMHAQPAPGTDCPRQRGYSEGQGKCPVSPCRDPGTCWWGQWSLHTAGPPGLQSGGRCVGPGTGGENGGEEGHRGSRRERASWKLGQGCCSEVESNLGWRQVGPTLLLPTFPAEVGIMLIARVLAAATHWVPNAPQCSTFAIPDFFHDTPGRRMGGRSRVLAGLGPCTSYSCLKP